MPLSADIDPDLFSDPISGDFPAGENLQLSEEGRAARSALRDLREEARRIERRADDGDSSEGGWAAARSVWIEVRDGGLDILRNRSRDLDIAAMTIEALARTDGFIGLAAGFAMTRVMVESLWNDLFPIPDPEDGPASDEAVVEERTLPLQRLVGMDSEGLLVPAILHIPLTQSRSDEQYAICHWRSSRDLVAEQSEEKLKLAVERGAVSPAQFEQAVATTPLPHLKEVYLELCQAAEQWELLSNAVSTASGGAAVLPAGPIRDLFEECDAAIRTFAPSAIPAPEQTATDNGDATADEAGADGEGGGGRPGAPTGRAEAFSQLESIADFFERHDPHSLIGAQIRSVVRLGRLPREAYYRELLRDESALALLFRAAGMDGDSGGASGD
ncbi:MAG: type VI secretion system protein TssA [Planctomycetia bacterium]|nr:type VI secretion system protein TssA [Planctomycetia bacterium]